MHKYFQKKKDEAWQKDKLGNSKWKAKKEKVDIKSNKKKDLKEAKANFVIVDDTTFKIVGEYPNKKQGLEALYKFGNKDYELMPYEIYLRDFKESRLKEVTSKYYRDIEKIEEYLGYDEAIDDWSKFISVDDAEFFLDAMSSEYDIPIISIRSRNDVFSVIDKFKDNIDSEALFNELFYNVSDKVAEYLVKGIADDLDESIVKKYGTSLQKNIVESKESLEESSNTFKLEQSLLDYMDGEYSTWKEIRDLGFAISNTASLVYNSEEYPEVIQTIIDILKTNKNKKHLPNVGNKIHN